MDSKIWKKERKLWYSICSKRKQDFNMKNCKTKQKQMGCNEKEHIKEKRKTEFTKREISKLKQTHRHINSV